ncbi:MAG: BrnT family toxin [Burkholderiaceae bacterium]|nr:BrnT family toxin [Burkholderiaceae bacterium]
MNTSSATFYMSPKGEHPLQLPYRLGMTIEFEWDAAKAEANHRKHGISFEEATTAFYDALSFTIPDPLHSQREARFVLLVQCCMLCGTYKTDAFGPVARRKPQQ